VGQAAGLCLRRPDWLRFCFVVAALASASGLRGQQSAEARGATVTGHVREAASGHALSGATVLVEATALGAHSDSSGTFRIRDVPPGPQMLTLRRIGFAVVRVPITVPPSGTLVVNVAMAYAALHLDRVLVTADPAGRAQGELGTASVIGREAIASQTAASLEGVLELIPGVPLSPPGLDGVQQIPLRSVPTAYGGGAGGFSAAQLAAFGTLIILDGLPQSNNANLQSTGLHADLAIPTSAGGGIDLRRLPATTIERVQVIRGVPSARFGDLTQGAIIIDTRAGAVTPEALLRYDPRSTEATLVAGRALPGRGALSGTLDFAQTHVAPATLDNLARRVSGQLAHRAVFGHEVGDSTSRLVLDTRADFYQVLEDNPERPLVRPGAANWSRDHGVSLGERARLGDPRRSTITLTLSANRTQQRSYAQSLLLRPALPFTDRLTPGQSVGHFVAGQYLARVHVDGAPWLLYSRLEGERAFAFASFDHRVRVGAEARREWNDGPGYQFAIETPPQSSFDGVAGFDRPRRYDAVPPLPTTAAYLDDRLVRALPWGMGLDLQAGMRVDVLHRGRWWASRPRSAVGEPRLNIQLSLRPWIRLRAGAGRLAKVPSLGAMYPPPNYFDVVNVNWFTNDPAGRLAILTTSIRDPTNKRLGFSSTQKAEAGLEVDVGQTATISLTAFSDRTAGAVGFRQLPGSLLRAHYQLTDSSTTSGRPPGIIEPPSAYDTVPILIDQAANDLLLRDRGVELTAALPEIPQLHTRVEILGSWVETHLSSSDIDFGPSTRFTDFQVGTSLQRVPIYSGLVSEGQRTVVTWRVIHQQPALGLVLVGTVQQTFHESTRNIGLTDSLAFIGYVDRAGTVTLIPPAQRSDPTYRDLRQARGAITDVTSTPAGWLFSLQLSKSIGQDGRLSFYAYNALNRVGTYGSIGSVSRLYAPARFGLELTIPIGRRGAR
jgi:Carboxypeptidase regulatory-like domain/TonB-dependent Receptor Plug Domain